MEVRSEAEGEQGRKSSNDLVQRNPARAHHPKYDVQSASSLEEVTACRPVVSRSMQCTEVPVIRERGSLRKRGRDVILAAPRRSSTIGRFSSSSSAAATPTVEAMNKAKRRLPGSRRKQQMEAPGSSRTRFFLQVVTIETGEDVVPKIESFLQQGRRRAVFVLSASGVISKVTFQEETTSLETLIYEGHLGLVSLAGISLPSDSRGQRSYTGRLSVLLAFLDGRVLGGVPRSMMAASPVQVIFGSFVPKDIEALDKSKEVDPMDTASTPVATAPVAAMGASNSTSQGAPGGFPGSPMSPVFRSTGTSNSNQQGWL